MIEFLLGIYSLGQGLRIHSHADLFSIEFSLPASSPYFNWGKIERTRQGHVVYVYVCVSAWMHVSRWQQTGQLSSLQLLLLPWASRQINADERLSKGGRQAWHTSSGLPFNKDYAEEKAVPETAGGLLCCLICVWRGAFWTAVRDRFCMMQFKQKLTEPSWITQRKAKVCCLAQLAENKT